MKKSFKPVVYYKKYTVKNDNRHWTLTAEDGSVIEFDFYMGFAGRVLENIVGADRSTASTLAYQLLWQM